MGISSNIEQMIKKLSDIEKKQIPYATSVALNNTAEIAMKAMKHKIDKDFDITASWNKVGGKYGIKKKRATKKNLQVEIFIPNANTWIEDHQEGDTRYNQLVPTKVFKKLYPNLKTNRAIKKKAQSLLGDASKNRIFEAKIDGDKYIMQREKGKIQGKRRLRGKSGRLLKPKKVFNRSVYPLFLVADQAKQTKKLEFYSTIIDGFEKNFNKEFDKAFEYAIRTAK
jgi:hypothetical protein